MSVAARARSQADPGDHPAVEPWIETAALARVRREIEGALRAGAGPVVLTGPDGHGKSLLLRQLWLKPLRGVAPIPVPSAGVPPERIARAILASSRAGPIHDAEGALARLLRTQSVRGLLPVMIVDDLESMSRATLAQLRAIVAGVRVEIGWLCAGRAGSELDAVLGEIGQPVRHIALDAPWTRADAERLIPPIAASLSVSPDALRARLDLDALLRDAQGNPRRVQAALAARVAELDLPPPESERAIDSPRVRLPAPMIAGSRANSDPAAAAAALEARRQSEARREARRAAARERRARATARLREWLAVALESVVRAACALRAFGLAARVRAAALVAQLSELAARLSEHGVQLAAGARALGSAARARLRRPRIPAQAVRAMLVASGALLAGLALVWLAGHVSLSTPASQPAPVQIAAVEAAPPPVEAPKIPVAVNSTPWAHVEVDGFAAGSTPLTIELSPGAHLFRAKLADGRTLERRYDVSAKRNRVAFR
jgi:hypothetical protein